MIAIEAEHLTKVYGSGHTEVVALRDADLSVSRGELVAVLGPSGSGKTTLLTCLGCIVEPTRGRVVIDGTTVYDEGWALLSLKRLRRRKIGFIFQSQTLIPFLSALENVLIALDINDVRGRKARKIAHELLDYLGIAERMDHMPSMLSGGEQQRVAIARALANSPAVLLCDEPTAALDTERGKSVMDLFKRVAKDRDSAVIVVTHDHRMVEGFDRIYHVKDGTLSA